MHCSPPFVSPPQLGRGAPFTVIRRWQMANCEALLHQDGLWKLRMGGFVLRDGTASAASCSVTAQPPRLRAPRRHSLRGFLLPEGTASAASCSATACSSSAGGCFVPRRQVARPAACPQRRGRPGRQVARSAAADRSRPWRRYGGALHCSPRLSAASEGRAAAVIPPTLSAQLCAVSQHQVLGDSPGGVGSAAARHLSAHFPPV